MSDHQSATIFVNIFTDLARGATTPERLRWAKHLARKWWALRNECDFSDREMEIDRVLVKLGLARRVDCDDWGEPGYEYGPVRRKTKRARRKR